MARKMSQYNAKCEGAGLGYVQQAEVSVYPFLVSATIAQRIRRDFSASTTTFHLNCPTTRIGPSWAIATKI
jgi:hypothetical protein